MLAGNSDARYTSRRFGCCCVGRAKHAGQRLSKQIDATKHGAQAAKSLLYLAHTIPTTSIDVRQQSMNDQRKK
jgi:hypothetical protein